MLNSNGDTVSVKRKHGFGDLLFLLPVLDDIYKSGLNIELITTDEWQNFVESIRPHFKVNGHVQPNTIDLDALTSKLKPSKHRTLEFYELLNIKPSSENIGLVLSANNSKKLIEENYIVIAPEANHVARQWSYSNFKTLCSNILNKKIVVVGREQTEKIPCDIDLRGKISVDELVTWLLHADYVISLDSGVLHLANALNKSTIAIFGGINPYYRVLDNHKALILRAKLNCNPCNKEESCDNKFFCLQTIKPNHVLEATAKILEIEKRTLWDI